MNFDQVKLDSLNKWPGILSQLGIDVGTGKPQFCPICSPGDPKSDRFKFEDIDKRNDTANGSYFCRQCGPGTGIDLVIKVLGIEYKEAMETIGRLAGTVEPSKHQPEKPPSPDVLRKMYKESHPVKAGDAVQKYLQKRGLSGMPKTLRYSTKVWEPETKKPQRAMLATFQLPDGEAVTIHRTYIDGEGNKLSIKSPKKIMPTIKKMTGGAVRLYEYNPAAPSPVLGVCEGIETAIAIHEHYSMPVWPCLSAVLLEGFIPPDEVTHLAIFGDNDKNYTGQKAAYTLANRMAIERKIIAEIEIPDMVGDDILDEMNRAKKGKQ